MLFLSNHVSWDAELRYRQSKFVHEQTNFQFVLIRFELHQASMPALVLCEVHGDIVQNACEGRECVPVGMP